MVVYLDEYRKAALMRGERSEARTAADTRATMPVSNVFRFRHPAKAHRATATGTLVYAEIDEDLDRVYALASQS